MVVLSWGVGTGHAPADQLDAVSLNSTLGVRYVIIPPFRSTCHRAAFDARQVLSGLNIDKALSGEQGAHRFTLVVAMLQQQPAAGLQVSGACAMMRR
jgi:hypothetical protein